MDRFFRDTAFADVAFQPFAFLAVLFRGICSAAQPDGQCLEIMTRAFEQFRCAEKTRPEIQFQFRLGIELGGRTFAQLVLKTAYFAERSVQCLELFEPFQHFLRDGITRFFQFLRKNITGPDLPEIAAHGGPDREIDHIFFPIGIMQEKFQIHLRRRFEAVPQRFQDLRQGLFP